MNVYNRLVSNTIFTARNIVTMNPANPEATAVAVRDGMIIAVGSFEECASWGEHEVDDRFADKVLVPGFVEAHGHTMDALAAMVPYLGYYPYPLADGTLTEPIQTYEALVAKLRAIDAQLPEGEQLLAIGFDPIFSRTNSVSTSGCSPRFRPLGQSSSVMPADTSPP
jgi:predicted amidohydrolase YtcJ